MASAANLSNVEVKLPAYPAAHTSNTKFSNVGHRNLPLFLLTYSTHISRKRRIALRLLCFGYAGFSKA